MLSIELQDIIDSVDIIEYVGRYIDLEEQNGEMFGLSPFKKENTPSFSVTPETQLFYDFSAGFGGNILTFIQRYNKCSFGTAVDMLKQYANITEDYVDTRLSATKTIKKFKASPNRKAKEVTHKILPSDAMSRYELNESKLKIWENEGISQETLKKYQVRYDPFSNRLVYPIRDLHGSIISIKGRTLNPDWKTTVINGKRMRKYTYFQEIGDIDTFFGYYEHLEQIKQQKEIIIFEGEKSVMIAETWGIQNAVAMLTSHLNPLQLVILIKLGVRVIFALDKEIDISQDENIKKLSHFTRIEYVRDAENLIGEKDAPVDKGIDIWKKLYEGRKSLN